MSLTWRSGVTGAAPRLSYHSLQILPPTPPASQGCVCMCVCVHVLGEGIWEGEAVLVVMSSVVVVMVVVVVITTITVVVGQ